MNLGTALLELDVPEHQPGFFDELRDELGERKTGVARPRLLLIAAAAAVVAGALAFGLTRGSEVASAAQVRAAVEHALASTGSISGVFVSQSYDPHGPLVRWRFIVSSTGAFRIDVLAGPDGQGSWEVYDPVRNTDTSSQRFEFPGHPEFGRHSDYTRDVGLAAGPPDESPAIFTGQLGLGSVVAALARAHDSNVETVTYEGRPAWLLRTPTGNPGDQEVVTIDRATGLPVRRELLHYGHLAFESRIEQLRVSATVVRITPPDPARGQSVSVHNAGFRRTSLAGARDAAGYSPLVPKQLPHGFTLADIVFASATQATGALLGPANPPSRDVISLAYRRGFDEIVVTTRRTGPEPSAWKDPFSGLGPTPTPSRITFTGGALAGNSGNLVVPPDASPYIWTVETKLVVTIAGTVTRADLLRVANSLGAP